MTNSKFANDLDTSKPGICQEVIQDYNRVLSCVLASLDLSGKLTKSKKKSFEKLRLELQGTYYEFYAADEDTQALLQPKKKEVEMKIIGLVI